MAQAAARTRRRRPAPPAPRGAPSSGGRGKTSAGDVRSGEMEATDAEAVKPRLRRWASSRRRSAGEAEGASTSASRGRRRQDEGPPRLHAPVLGDDRRGPPARAGARHHRHAGGQPAFKKVLLTVKARSRRAPPSPTRSREHPKVFDELFVQLVRAGEIGGILDTILQRLGAYIEKNEKLARRVKGAMVYPSIVLFVAVAVVIVLIAFVVPTFEKMFKDFGGAMPGADAVPHRPLARVPARPGTCSSASPSRTFVAFKAATRKGRARRSGTRVVLKLPLFGAAHAQGRGRPLHAHARHDALVGRADPRRARDRREVRRQHGSSRRACCTSAPKISEGKNIAGPLAETEGLPADGGADDRRRRGDRRDGRDARRRSPTSTTTRSTSRSRRSRA